MIGRIEVESGSTCIGAKFTAVGPDGARHELTTVRGATLRMKVGEANTLELDTILAPLKTTATSGIVVVACPLCDHAHTHPIGYRPE